MKKHVKKILLFLSLFGSTASFAAQAVPFSPYADLTINVNWNTMQPMDLNAIAQKNDIKSFHLAFIADGGQCQPMWGGQSYFPVSTKWASQLTDQLRANGTVYSIAFGGAKGADLSKACSEEQLVAAYENIIQIYQPQQFDLDIEGGNANVDNLIAALAKIHNKFPNLKMSFTLPVLPDGLTEFYQAVVKKAHAAGLHFSVNIMAMDYGPAFMGDMGEYAIQAATHLYLFLKELYPLKTDAEVWKMIEVTPMIGVNDTQGEQFTLANAATLKRFAEQNQLGGLAIWSIARDNPCPQSTWADPTCSGNNLQKTPYEFSKAFSYSSSNSFATKSQFTRFQK